MRTLALAFAALALAGCGGSDSSAPSAGAPIPGGGLSVEEALASDLDGPLMVKGFIVSRDEVRLCSALAESHPPQCAGASVRVEGFEHADIELDREAGGVAWTESQVSLLGEVDGGVLRVSETAR